MELPFVIVNTLATVAVAIYAVKSHCLSKKLSEAAAAHQQDLDDLFEAVVIATILSGPSSTGDFKTARQAFESVYKGKRKVFKAAS